MRPVLPALLSGAAAIVAAAPALAQPADRYGGFGTYQTPAPQAAQAPARPVRVLSWPGKTTPGAVAAPPAAVYGYAGASSAQPVYAPAPQAAYPASPPAYYGPVYGPQPQPYYAPAPGMPAPTPGSSATAPNGVYPPNTVPPQYAYPMTPAPQAASPLANGAPLPTSIYAAPQAALPAGARQPQQTASAAAAPSQGARLYSLHREFGLRPDPTPRPNEDGQAVELVSSIDSGPGPDPARDAGTRIRTRQTDASGKTVTRTAQLGGGADN